MALTVHRETRDLDPASERYLRFARGGDIAEMEALLRDCLDRGYSQARRMLGARADAEDAVQEAVLQLLREAPRYDSSVPFAVCWARLVYFACLRTRRSRVRTRRREAHARWMPLQENCPPADPHEEELAAQKTAQTVRQAVESLPEREQAAISLHYFAGLSQREAAAALGLRENALAVCLHRARRRLLARLSRQGVVVTGAVLVLALAKAPSYAASATLAASAAKLTAVSAAGAVLPATTLPIGILSRCLMFLHLHPFLTAVAAVLVLAGGAGGVSLDRSLPVIPAPVAPVLPTVKVNAAQNLRFAYEVTQPGQVSLAIFDSDGHNLRTVLTGEKLKPGKYSWEWDGLDSNGGAMPAGNYEWRLLETPGFKREYLATLGTDPGYGPWGSWPGNHGGSGNGPGGIVTLYLDDEGALYVGSPGAEACPNVVKMSLDGKTKYWESPYVCDFSGLTRIVRTGDFMYYLLACGRMYVVNSKNSGWTYGHPRYGKYAGQDNPFADVMHPKDKRTERDQPQYASITSNIDMALLKDQFIISYEKFNSVRVFTLKSGDSTDSLDFTKEIEVPEPRGLTVTVDGRIFCACSNKVVEIDVQKGQVKDVIKDPQMPYPTRVAFEPNSKDLLVVCGPESDRNTGFPHGTWIRRYHLQDCKLAAVYGNPKGRTYGVFNPLEFDKLHDVIADGKGGFVTCEEFPRRVATFKGREKIEVVNQWFGGEQWANVDAIDPADPAIGYIFPDGRHLARVKIDFAKHSWTMTHLWEPDYGCNFVPYFGSGSAWSVRHQGKDTLMVKHSKGDFYNGLMIVRIDDKANRLVPVACMGTLHPGLIWNPAKAPQWWRNALKRAGRNPDAPDGANRKFASFSWSDLNHDGKDQPEEIQLGSCGGNFWDGGQSYVDENWNVIRPIGYGLKEPVPPQGSAAFYVIKNEGTAECPKWNWDHAMPSKAQMPAKDGSLRGCAPNGFFKDRQGSVYSTATGTVDCDWPPLYWPNNASSSARLMKWLPDGSLDWTVGTHAEKYTNTPNDASFWGRIFVQPGQFVNPVCVLGEVRDCIAVFDQSNPTTFWTKDGIYVGSVLDGKCDPSLPDGAYLSGNSNDNQWITVFQDNKGDVYWLGGHTNNSGLYKVHGFDGWKRSSGKLAVHGAMPGAQWKGIGLKGEYFANKDLSGKSALTRVDPLVWFGPMWGDHREFTNLHPFLGDDAAAKGLTYANFSARWTGYFEAPLGEDYEFSVFTPLSNSNGTLGAKVRLWVDSKVIFERWNLNPADNTGTWGCTGGGKGTVRLRAGQKVPIKIEYVSANGASSHLHLYWKCTNFDMRHVPTALLYPEK